MERRRRRKAVVGVGEGDLEAARRYIDGEVGICELDRRICSSLSLSRARRRSETARAWGGGRDALPIPHVASVSSVHPRETRGPWERASDVDLPLLTPMQNTP